MVVEGGGGGGTRTQGPLSAAFQQEFTQVRQ